MPDRGTKNEVPSVLASFSVNTFFFGTNPIPSPAGVTISLFLSNSNERILMTMPIPAARKPHLKSAGFPVLNHPGFSGGCLV